MLQHVATEYNKCIPTFSHVRFATKTEMPVEILRARLSQLRDQSSPSSSTDGNLSNNISSPIPNQRSSSNTVQLPVNTDVITSSPPPILSSFPFYPFSPNSTTNNFPVPLQSPYPDMHLSLQPPPYSYHPGMLGMYPQPYVYIPSYPQQINSITDQSHNESYEMAAVLSSMKFGLR